ncbi:PREDICTED: filensin [Nanorana parkeri]|uniref:filensin n=1 Tax=Nanorana parkeri TaxID=125878 RepID=UPI000854C93A|nr:PREDICTED: filensin [Nanorana parkeri]
MYKTSYLREVRKEKYERSDGFDEQSLVDISNLGLSQAKGLENLQELNERFANYINRARVLEQRNAIFRKQLETFQRMDEISGLEEAFAEQIELNRQRIRELASDRSKLEREYKDAQRTVDEFKTKYGNECEYQQLLKGNLERLNKEADEALLSNLELQIESQFLQDDIHAAKDRYKKNLMEIQTYVNILQQIIQTTPPVTAITVGMYEEKLISERRIPILQCQLEEYKSILCQLQAQKTKLQADTSMLDQAIKNTQESYDDEIQLYNEQIEVLRKGIEEAERNLEKYTNDCRQLVIYQQSLENELERYKRIIENEDNRLNSAIVGTPITLFMQSYKSSQISPRGKDITLAIQDIATAKPRQKGVTRKMSRKKELSMEKSDVSNEDKVLERTLESVDKRYEIKYDDSVYDEAEKEAESYLCPEDVPDGAQISKAFDKLCNIVRDRIRGYKKPEPSPEIFTKGRYVLVTGESSYMDPCFCSSTPQAGGRITVSIIHDLLPGDDIVLPIPELPEPSESSESDDDEAGSDENKAEETEDDDKPKENDNDKKDQDPENNEEAKKPPDVTRPDSTHHGSVSSTSDSVKTQRFSRGHNVNDKEERSLRPLRGRDFPSSMSYEKVEVVESIEKISDDRVKSYEETAMIVETMIEKTRKK